jgi:hypothetical protein
MRVNALALAVALSVSPFVVTTLGCAARYAAYPSSSKDVTERIVQAHAAIASQRTNPFAAEATLDINRAESLLLAAEKRAADPEAVDEFLDLLLSTVEGQLVVVNTYFARRKAETTLDARRSVAADNGSDRGSVSSDARSPKRTNP